MKYYKITLGKDSKGLVYPENYQTEVGDHALDHLYWDENGQDYLLLVLPDDKVNIVRSGVEEITETDATAISTANETQTETVLDEVKLRRIELKAKIGTKLTKDESDAIDPTSATSVFGKTERLAVRVAKLKK
jgi:hypothetical protein